MTRPPSISSSVRDVKAATAARFNVGTEVSVGNRSTTMPACSPRRNRSRLENPRSEIRGHERTALAYCRRQNLGVRSSPETGLYHMDGVAADSPKRLREGPR